MALLKHCHVDSRGYGHDGTVCIEERNVNGVGVVGGSRAAPTASCSMNTVFTF